MNFTAAMSKVAANQANKTATATDTSKSRSPNQRRLQTIAEPDRSSNSTTAVPYSNLSEFAQDNIKKDRND
jgi:hypothetical protein